MKRKLVLITMMFTASFLILDMNDAEAQGWRTFARGYSGQRGSTRIYSSPAYRASAYTNRSYGTRYYSPYTRYSTGYNNYRGNVYPGGYRYRSNYGYAPQPGITFSFGNGGFGNSGFGNYGGFGY